MNGGKVVTVEEVKNDGSTIPHMIVKVSNEGVYLVSTAVGHMDSPLCQLKLPHKDGNKWNQVTALKPIRESIKLQKQAWTFTAHGPEEVKVPAGMFMAIRVDSVWGTGLPSESIRLGMLQTLGLSRRCTQRRSQTVHRVKVRPC
jgi:hypothetical protein